jgi:hypothetical protein
VLEFLDELPPLSDMIEFVDGPRSGDRVTTPEQPDEIPMEGGIYARSVRCVDDGALRYVWKPNEVELAARVND